jgi:hypothetical protein
VSEHQEDNSINSYSQKSKPPYLLSNIAIQSNTLTTKTSPEIYLAARLHQYTNPVCTSDLANCHTDSTRTARTLTSRSFVARTHTTFTKPLTVHDQTSLEPPAVLTHSKKDLQALSTSPPARVETRPTKQSLPWRTPTGISMSKLQQV